jgi:hypothetical protein
MTCQSLLAPVLLRSRSDSVHGPLMLATAVKTALDGRCIDATPPATVSDLKRVRTAHHQSGAQAPFACVRRAPAQRQQNCLAIDGLADMATIAQGIRPEAFGQAAPASHSRSTTRIENTRLMSKILILAGEPSSQPRIGSSYRQDPTNG